MIDKCHIIICLTFSLYHVYTHCGIPHESIVNHQCKTSICSLQPKPDTQLNRVCALWRFLTAILTIVLYVARFLCCVDVFIFFYYLFVVVVVFWSFFGFVHLGVRELLTTTTFYVSCNKQMLSYVSLVESVCFVFDQVKKRILFLSSGILLFLFVVVVLWLVYCDCALKYIRRNCPVADCCCGLRAMFCVCLLRKI